MDYRIFPPDEILETTVSLPLSKSVAARVIVLSALTPGGPCPDPAAMPDCVDTRVLLTATECTASEVSAHASGTAMRFLTAFFAARPGASVTLTGGERLSARPVAPLVDALRSMGADITYAAEEGRLPLVINGRRLRGGRVRLDASASSQFASALAMIGPLCEEGLDIDLGGEIASMPYLRMTLRMMQARGIDADIEGYTVRVPAGEYRPVAAECERDWSAASYWYEIAAVTAGWVTLQGMTGHSLQGDSVLARIGDRFGVLTEFTDEGAELSATPDLYSRLDMDMADYPDLVPALAVTAALIGLPFRFTGIENLRHKECDRIEVLAAGLRALGCVVETGPGMLGWEGAREPLTALPRIETHDDHRIAMAFAPAAVFIPGIAIADGDVVDKSYPAYWDDLRRAGFTLTDAAVPLPEAEEQA